MDLSYAILIYKNIISMWWSSGEVAVIFLFVLLPLVCIFIIERCIFDSMLLLSLSLNKKYAAQVIISQREIVTSRRCINFDNSDWWQLMTTPINQLMQIQYITTHQ